MAAEDLEEWKEVVRAFVGGATVVPGEARLEPQMRTLPAVGALRPGNSACGMVAGARYTPVQIDLEPADRFVGGAARRLAA
jgi:hypothetical protein